jgi:beta-fructofuranosidase
MTYSSKSHSDRYIWDFWYYFDSQQKLFHLFYLNAEKSLVAKEKHHLHSQIGYGTTYDFRKIKYLNFNVLEASDNYWANTSIWSGDIIKINNGFLLLFTSRNKYEDDGFTQNIGIAYSQKDFNNWAVSDIRIPPDFVYEPRSISGDTTIHAWRDPFLFRIDQQVYLLVSAKSISSPIGRKGVIGLLKMKNNSFKEWEYLNPISEPSSYSEMEVPQLYINTKNEYELIFSCRSKYDFKKTTNKAGGLQSLISSNWQNFRDSQVNVILPESSGIYACRVIPELEGEIVGFDLENGNIQRTYIKTYFKHISRNFDDLNFQI